MILDIITKNRAKELIKEEVRAANEDMWKEIDGINNKINRLEEDIKIIYNGKQA